MLMISRKLGGKKLISFREKLKGGGGGTYPCALCLGSTQNIKDVFKINVAL